MTNQTCERCKSAPMRNNSRKGMCDKCTREDNAEKARLRAAEQTKRLQSSRSARNICSCGCGQVCRAGASYATRQHRTDHEKRQRQHAQPRKYPEAVQLRKMQQPLSRRRPEEIFAPVPISNPGIPITRIANPFQRASLRNFFGDERGETWSAAD